MKIHDFDQFVKGYTEAALFTEGLELVTLSVTAEYGIKESCTKFCVANQPLIEKYAQKRKYGQDGEAVYGLVGHDF